VAVGQVVDANRTDALTRLPNRAVVMERLQRALEHAERHAGYGFAVLFMDFDRFKQVNDSPGHSAGDEFVVVLDGAHEPEDPVVSTAGIGIVCVARRGAGEPWPDAVELLRNADTAMDEAQRAGGGRCVVFDRSVHERVVHALAFEADLRVARTLGMRTVAEGTGTEGQARPGVRRHRRRSMTARTRRARARRGAPHRCRGSAVRRLPAALRRSGRGEGHRPS
jgi:GGDEF domain-containing protein